VILQAGAFAGHRRPEVAERQAEVDGPWLTVCLPAATWIRLTLRLMLRSRTPSYATPFDEASSCAADDSVPRPGRNGSEK
jgi:hypothetical protein